MVGAVCGPEFRSAGLMRISSDEVVRRVRRRRSRRRPTPVYTTANCHRYVRPHHWRQSPRWSNRSHRQRWWLDGLKNYAASDGANGFCCALQTPSRSWRSPLTRGRTGLTRRHGGLRVAADGRAVRYGRRCIRFFANVREGPGGTYWIARESTVAARKAQESDWSGNSPRRSKVVC